MITSKDNPHLKQARAVRKGNVAGQIFIEGLRLCEEAVRSGIGIVEVLYTPDFALDPRGKNLLAELKTREIQSLLVPEKLLGSVADTKTPQGVIILAVKPQNDGAILARRLAQQNGNLSLIVILHAMNNPANLGAILRTAEAAGVAGVIVTKNSADPFSPKALRGAMGATLRLPVWYGAEFSEAIEWAKNTQLLVACADIQGRSSYSEVDWKEPHALVIGSEGHGLCEAEIALCDESFKISMSEPVESLNAAVAAGIILFEARRVTVEQT